MTFIIGDIHGEIHKLKKLILNIKLIDKNSEFIFIGDYLNKGENSKKTLDFLVKLNNSTFLMGNHEYYFMEFVKHKRFKDKLLKYAESSTFQDFNMNINNIEEILYLPYKNFFDNLKTYHQTSKYFISHAGVDVRYSTQKIQDIPSESFLFNDRYKFLQSNFLMNGKVMIFGHTGFSFPYIDDSKIGIDTSAVYAEENPLTAFCIDKEYFIDNQNNIKELESYSKNICPVIIRKPPYREER